MEHVWYTNGAIRRLLLLIVVFSLGSIYFLLVNVFNLHYIVREINI